MTLQAPFPYFGGKSKVSGVIWDALGDVSHYVEPFFGSGAVLLARPHGPKVETVNDLDGFLANFWRAVQADPEAVAHHADWPTNEVDLHARHLWLVANKPRVVEMMAQPDAYDAQAAGWWMWGACNWIGGGWCRGNGPWVERDGELVDSRQLPHLSAGRGINRKLPHMGDAGRGINRKLPHMGDAGRGEFIRQWMSDLSARLRGVRVACGDWSRVCGPSVLRAGGGVCGVFLDPPYSADGRSSVYAEETDVFRDVTAWALANGADQKLRIVVAGYSGEHADLEAAGWSSFAWKAKGGYGSQGDGRGRENASRETLWLSPHCLRPETGGLFEVRRGDA